MRNKEPCQHCSRLLGSVGGHQASSLQAADDSCAASCSACAEGWGPQTSAPAPSPLRGRGGLLPLTPASMSSCSGSLAEHLLAFLHGLTPSTTMSKAWGLTHHRVWCPPSHCLEWGPDSQAGVMWWRAAEGTGEVCLPRRWHNLHCRSPQSKGVVVEVQSGEGVRSESVFSFKEVIWCSWEAAGRSKGGWEETVLYCGECSLISGRSFLRQGIWGLKGRSTECEVCSPWSLCDPTGLPAPPHPCPLPLVLPLCLCLFNINRHKWFLIECHLQITSLRSKQHLMSITFFIPIENHWFAVPSLS